MSRSSFRTFVPIAFGCALFAVFPEMPSLHADEVGYVQTGYLFPEVRVQPWALYEEWNSDSPGGDGSYENIRVGATYFARGHNLNFKLGYERTRLDSNPTGDTVSHSILAGAYLSF